MKIMVTGGDGLLGSNLVRELLKRNYEVSVLIYEKSYSKTLEELNIKKIKGNILNPELLNKSFKAYDCVIHCAASTEVIPSRSENIRKLNIEGTQNVINAVLSNSISRLIHVGTASSFGFGTNIDQLGNETKPYISRKYRLDYMDSKYEAQQLVLQFVRTNNLPALVVNPTFMIGPYDSKPSSGQLILSMYNKKVPGFTKGGKNYVHVKDAAIAIANSINMGKIGECYILGNENLSFEEFFKKIAQTLGVDPPRTAIPNWLILAFSYSSLFLHKLIGKKPIINPAMAKVSCDKHFYAVEKARKELNLPSTPIEVAIDECFQWFKDNGYIKG